MYKRNNKTSMYKRNNKTSILKKQKIVKKQNNHQLLNK